MSNDKFHHHPFLGLVANDDVERVIPKDVSYGASWKKRGGVGAYMMLARKWDRLEEMMSGKYGYNIFAGVEAGVLMENELARSRTPTSEEIHVENGTDGTVLAEIRDLRRYLLLVEAEMMARGVVPTPEKMVRAADFVDVKIGPMSAVSGGVARAGDSDVVTRSVPRMREQPSFGENESANLHEIGSPWVLDAFHWENSVPLDLRQLWWNTRGLGENATHVLEPFVPNHVNCPRPLHGYYDLSNGNLWTLRMSRVPDAVRDQFPHVDRELNMTEYDAIDRWHQTLYEWHESENKYRLKPRNMAWGKEA